MPKAYKLPSAVAAKKLSLIPKDALVSTFLVANAFVWYLCGLSYLQGIADGNLLLLVIAANFVCLVLTALLVTSLASKFKQRLVFLKYWVVAGSFLSVLFAILNLSHFSSILIMACIIGMFFGAGMPICMGYYAKTTEPQHRAKSSGIIILLIGVGVPMLSILGGGQSVILAAVLALWQIFTLFFVLSLKPSEINVETKDSVSYLSVVSNKAFLLYVIPWFMFSLINDLTMQLNVSHFSSSTFPQSFGQNFMMVENVLAGASAIICGFLADRKGRKRLALIGLALLGIGYASLGIFSTNYYIAWFYVCVDGIAWGVFSMLFLLTIWGDIAQEKSAEKYYFLGVLPYLFSNLARGWAGTYISSSMEHGMIFSFASFFLFVAILPLAYAPETLPEKVIKRIDINSYVEKALEKAQRGNEKTSKRGKGKK